MLKFVYVFFFITRHCAVLVVYMRSQTDLIDLDGRVLSIKSADKSLTEFTFFSCIIFQRSKRFVTDHYCVRHCVCVPTIQCIITHII